MRQRIAKSIINDPTPFLVEFFAQFTDKGIADVVRSMTIHDTFRNRSDGSVRALEGMMKKLGRRYKNMYTLATSREFQKSVALYASMMQGSGNAWGGPIEIQAYANATQKPVAMYTTGSPVIRVFLPNRGYPITVHGATSNNTQNLMNYTRHLPIEWQTMLPLGVTGIVYNGKDHFDALMCRHRALQHISGQKRKR